MKKINTYLYFKVHIQTFHKPSLKDSEWDIRRLVTLHGLKSIAYTCDENILKPI
jgi:hypothetical protein